MKYVKMSFLFVCLMTNFHILSSSKLPTVECQTSKGPLTIEVHRDWAPLGADRFIELVRDQFYTDIAFFRCVPRFLTQFGISDKPSKKHWHNNNIPDDPNLHLGIRKNYISFAGGGPNTRSTQLFIAFEYLDFLGNEPWETPFGVVVEGQSTLDGLYKGYGDIPPFGKGVDQQRIHREGNAYVREEFPKTDFIYSCRLLDTAEEVMAPPQPKQEETVGNRLRSVAAVTEERRREEGVADVVTLNAAGRDDGVKVESSEVETEGDGLADTTLIYRAVGFLLIAVLLLLLYLRVNPSSASAGKAQ